MIELKKMIELLGTIKNLMWATWLMLWVIFFAIMLQKH